LASIDTMRALLEEEIGSHKGKVDENQDFIGYYLDQMAKVSVKQLLLGSIDK